MLLPVLQPLMLNKPLFPIIDVTFLNTHLKELPISCPNEENHPGLVSHRQHRCHVVLPEEHCLRLQSPCLQSTVTMIIQFAFKQVFIIAETD